MDEEDFRIRVRPEPKEMRPKPPALLKLVRRAVLMTVEDHVVLDELVKSLLSTRHAVGRCMTLLAKEGILTGLRSVPKGETHEYCGHTVVWRGGVWAVKEPSWVWTRMRKDPRQTISRKERAEYDRKNPPTDSGWDGRAYYVIRGTAFKAAARSEGLPEDPKADWECACGAMSAYAETSCRKCHESRPVPRAETAGPPPEPKPLICERCGSPMDMVRRRGRRLHPDHGLRKCNVNVVTGVMED